MGRIPRERTIDPGHTPLDGGETIRSASEVRERRRAGCVRVPDNFEADRRVSARRARTLVPPCQQCAAAWDAGSVVRKVSELPCRVRRLSLTSSLDLHAARSRHYVERPLHCRRQRATQRVLRVLHSTTWYVRPLRFSIVLGGLTCGRSLERRWNAR